MFEIQTGGHIDFITYGNNYSQDLYIYGNVVFNQATYVDGTSSSRNGWNVMCGQNRGYFLVITAKSTLTTISPTNIWIKSIAWGFDYYPGELIVEKEATLNLGGSLRVGDPTCSYITDHTNGKLTNNGTININPNTYLTIYPYGTLTNSGTINNNGNLVVKYNASNLSGIYTGNDPIGNAITKTLEQ